MARGYFHVPEDMSAALVGIRLKKVARITDDVTRQLQSLSGLTVQDYHFPAPPGVPAKPVPAATLQHVHPCVVGRNGLRHRRYPGYMQA